MDISIIIPAYNAAGTLRECLAACLQQEAPAKEIIVVDDGSTDDTARIAENTPGVRCVRQTNRGPAAARNRGAREATGALLVFTDADCVPHGDWLKELAAAFTPKTTAAGGTYGIANPQFRLARLVYEEILWRHERLEEEVDFLGSFNVAYRKEAFETVGGFDECFRHASGEDNDLAYRLRDAGASLRFVPGAIVDHYHPTRLLPYLRTQRRHGYWRVKLYFKHAGRVRGDQYAGLRELMAPGLALALLGCILLFPCLPYPLAMLALFAAGWAVLLYPGTPRGISQYLSVPDRLVFGLLRFVRDVARGLGMIQGCCAFAWRRTA